MLKVGGADHVDTPAPEDVSNPGPAAAEEGSAGGDGRLAKLSVTAQDTVAAVAGEGLGIVGSAAKGAKGVVDLAAGVTGALGARAQTSAQNQQTKREAAEATSDSKIAAAVSESEKQAYKVAIEAENKAQELRQKKLTNEMNNSKAVRKQEMDNFKAVQKQSEQQRAIKDKQDRGALSVVNANKVEIVGKGGKTHTTSFKKLEEKRVGDINMVFAVPKTMDDLNGELFKKFGRNFVNGGFELDRTDKNSLFRSLAPNFPVPPVEYLKGWLKWLRGQIPVLREKKDESDEVVAAQPEVSHSHPGVALTPAAGGGKTKRKKKTSKRKKKTSKRKKKTYKRKKKTYKRKKRTLKKRY
jgi:hypothetical protein